MLLAIVAVNTWSIIGAMLSGRPFPGTVELTEIGTAVAVFLFLPWAEITGANLTADVFTASATPRIRARIAAGWTLVTLGGSLLLLQRMSEGLADQRAYGTTTAILQIPVWWGYAPALVALALLVCACLARLAVAVGEA